MTSLVLDMSAASDTPFEPISPGFYLLEIEKVDPPKEQRNNWYDFDVHPDGEPYEDDKGYLVYPTRFSFRVYARPIADASESFDDEDVIFIWFNLNRNRKTGALRPNDNLRALMTACGVSSGKPDELVGATCWANVKHVYNDDKTFRKFEVDGYTDQAPKRRSRTSARQEPPQAAPDPANDEPEPDYEEGEVPFDGSTDDAAPTEQNWIDRVYATRNLDDLNTVATELRATNAGTPEVRAAYTKKLHQFRAVTRITP